MVALRIVLVLAMAQVALSTPIFKHDEYQHNDLSPFKNPNCSGTELCPVWPSEFKAVSIEFEKRNDLFSNNHNNKKMHRHNA
jgi:hypothetical protein